MGGAYQAVRDVAAKVAGNVARLAALFHVLEHGPIGTIGSGHIQGAEEVVCWHLYEARRLLAEPDTPSALAAATRLDNWLLHEARTTGDPRIPTTRICQYGRRRYVVVNPALLAGGCKVLELVTWPPMVMDRASKVTTAIAELTAGFESAILVAILVASICGNNRVVFNVDGRLAIEIDFPVKTWISMRLMSKPEVVSYQPLHRRSGRDYRNLWNPAYNRPSPEHSPLAPRGIYRKVKQYENSETINHISPIWKKRSLP